VPARGAAPPRSEPSTSSSVPSQPPAETGEAGLRTRRSEAFESLEVVCRDDRRDGAPAPSDDDGGAVFGAADVRRQLIACLGDGDLLGHAVLQIAIIATLAISMESAHALTGFRTFDAR
jgi:hypothetical protein